MQLSYTWVLANKKKNLTSKENAALKKKKKKWGDTKAFILGLQEYFFFWAVFVSNEVKNEKKICLS